MLFLNKSNLIQPAPACSRRTHPPFPLSSLRSPLPFSGLFPHRSCWPDLCWVGRSPPWRPWPQKGWSCRIVLIVSIFLHFFVPAEIDVHQAKAAHPSEHVTPGGRHSPRQFRTAPMPRQEPYCVRMVCTTSNPVPTYPVWLQTIHPIMWHHTRCLLQHRVL